MRKKPNRHSRRLLRLGMVFVILLALTLNVTLGLQSAKSYVNEFIGANESTSPTETPPTETPPTETPPTETPPTETPPTETPPTETPPTETPPTETPPTETDRKSVV